MSIIAGSKTGDDRYATYIDACSIPLPKRTRSYEPVANKRMIDTIKEAAESRLNMPMLDEKYILSHKDQVMLGMLRFVTERPELPLTVLFRNSYGKQASAAIASGPSAKACSNLEIFDGDICKVRRHTPNVWKDFLKHVETVMASAKSRYDSNLVQIDTWKDHEISGPRGGELLGLARYENILTKTMFNVAMDHWKEPPEDFKGENNLWGLYNAGTWAIGQKANARELLNRSVKLSALTKSVQWHHPVAESK